jgi:hypothetical protein
MGRTHGEIGDIPHDEYIRWRAFMTWRAVQREHQQDVAAMRARRRSL